MQADKPDKYMMLNATGGTRNYLPAPEVGSGLSLEANASSRVAVLADPGFLFQNLGLATNAQWVPLSRASVPSTNAVSSGLIFGEMTRLGGLSRASFTQQAERELLEPVELGEPHPFERLLRSSLEISEGSKWLLDFFCGSRSEERRRSIVLALGRMQYEGVGDDECVERIVGMALMDEHLSVREAGVRAAELLGPMGIRLLTTYVSSEVAPWLQRYAEGVLSDLLRRKNDDR